jgi:hypothetical protein
MATLKREDLYAEVERRRSVLVRWTFAFARLRPAAASTGPSAV